jgi:hypothetical protein
VRLELAVVLQFEQLICFWALYMIRKKAAGKVLVSRSRIVRAVASSSALETGEPTQVIERRLKSGTRRFPRLTLAFR